MKKLLARWANKLWYEDVYIATWFTLINMLFVDAVRFRRFLYRCKLFKSTKLSIPVIVVGNLTVGGTGKTPVVIALAKALEQQGYKVGIITRGYGSKSNQQPQCVDKTTDPNLVGDEAVLIKQANDCPVAVCVDRAKAAQLILDKTPCDVLLSDDGLQHYALQRDIEIVVIDGERRFGNNYCLPFGPLREPPERLQEVDFVIVNGGEITDNEILMMSVITTAINLKTGENKPLSDFKQQLCHAIAGIGNPQRFFNALGQQNIECKTHAFPDHYLFSKKDISFKENHPVLMTEKDAVKCKAFATEQHWFVPLEIQLPESFFQQLFHLLETKTHG